MIDIEETIVAIASPTAPALRGIVRLSGAGVADVLGKLGVPVPIRSAAYRQETELDLGDPLGRLPASLLVWPNRRSYTGQPSAEIHSIGSLPVLQCVVERATQSGARPARPGEFTMRAFLAGRLDLTQAEAVLGVIEAEGRGTLDSALRQLGGNLSRPLERVRSTMLDLLADVEAGLDFVDEDIEFVSDEALVAGLSEIGETLKRTAATLRSRDGVADRVLVALCGEPNAGKSQLFNRLAGEEAAIVSDTSGTTRDVVTADVDLRGLPVRLVDTAGLDSIQCRLSGLAQKHSRRAAQDAQLRLWCVDLSRTDLNSATERLQSAAAQSSSRQIDLWVGTKADLTETRLPSPWITTSTQEDSGLDRLIGSIVSCLADRDREETGSVVGTAARCRDSLRGAIDAIDAAIGLAARQEGHEWVAAELRTAVECLGEVTGAVYTEDILDRVFSRFCIGK